MMAHLLLKTQLIQSLICFILFVRTTSQASAPTITSAPNFVFQRQENEGPAFLGYQALKDGRYNTETCDGSSTYFTSSRWAACVTDDADLYTGCANGSVVLVPTGNGTCGPSKTCGSGLIYNNPTDATALSYVGCFSNTLRPTYYRQKRTSSTTITTTLATTMTSSALSEARAGPISTSTSTSSTASPSPTEKPAPQNLAWVAGPVVGGIAGLAIIALLVWIVLLLRKKQSHAPTPENQFVQPDYTAKPTYQAQIYPSPGPEQAPRVMSMGPSQYPSAPTYELEHVTYHGPRPGA
uniref:Mid2 domain-containing protein n=1 Tax=Bionectria ochroleuca TaxID=29856 RepID=A0A8H7K9N7_BIOOC